MTADIQKTRAVGILLFSWRDSKQLYPEKVLSRPSVLLDLDDLMNTVPRKLSDAELVRYSKNTCGACSASVIHRTPDTEWVCCPMVDSSPICFGCCLDLQGLVRSSKFSDNPYRDLLDPIEKSTGKSAKELRTICLAHQVELLTSLLEDQSMAFEHDDALELLKYVQRVQPKRWAMVAA